MIKKRKKEKRKEEKGCHIYTPSTIKIGLPLSLWSSAV
jgi:hypothetical protein